jgi:cytochrome P450 family 4
LYNIAKYPDIQKKVYDEIISVIGDDVTTPVTLKMLNSLNYLEMVIKENLRIFPSVPMYGRKMKENVEISTKNV